MKKKIIVICICLAGVILVSGNSKGMLVKSSDIAVSITPETPEEEKSYYVENQTRIFQQKEEEKRYNIYYNMCMIQKCEYQATYLQALKEELESKRKIEEGKLDLGYTTQISVQDIDTQLKEVIMQMETVQEQEKYYKEVVSIYGGEYVALGIGETVSELSEDYINEFFKDNLQIKYYEYQIKTYEEYLREHKEAENVEDIRIQKQIAELDKQKYEADLQIYVKGKVLQYETILRNITQLNDEIELIEEKIRINNTLCENGKIAEISIIEFKTEQKRLMYEKMSLVYDADCIRYILEHKIEGVEI